MWQTLREMSGLLEQYKDVKADSAFIDMMLSSVRELHANSITPEKCEKAAESCGEPILKRKLCDIAAIYQAYTAKLEKSVGESALMSEDKLHRLADTLSHNKFFTDTEIFIDSFTDFTGEEFDVIEQIMLQSKASCMSFTYKRGHRAPHTETLSETVKRLTRFAKENGIDTVDITLGDSTDVPQNELDVIERYLWDFSVDKSTLCQGEQFRRGAVQSYVCENEFEEAWLAALNVIKAKQSGVKYSDIAIITRDPEGRRGMLEAVFESAGIPYFYSQRTDLSATAPARLVLAALRCISHGFNQSDVINLIKTGLCDVDAHDADLFEDYCYTWNINGKTFLEDAWSMNPDGYTADISERGQQILIAANRVRDAIIPPLVDLRRAMAASCGDTVQNCKALHNYLDTIGLAQSISSLAESSLASGNVKEAGELVRVYDYIISVLTDICTVMGDDKTSVEELCCAIEIMLKNTDIGSVPAVNDCVTVGSAATLRIENVKIAILLGLCEGEFPASYSDDGILSENDKQIMQEMGISLSSREDKIMSDELFYVYRAMTKPQDKLIISTCRASVSGRAMTPSTAFNRVHFLLPHLKPQSFDLSRVRTLAKLMTKGDTETDNATSAPVATSNVTEQDDLGAEIDPAYVRLLFGDNLYLSKSRITAFAECPYKYWCEYVLDLREKKVSEVSYDNAGTIIHYVLENLVKRLLRDDGGLEYIDDETLISYVNEMIGEYVNSINCPLPPYMMHSFSRLRDLALIMAQSVVTEFAQSSFKVVGLEKHISARREGALKPMVIKVDESEQSPVVSLGGVIDRVDCYDDGVNKYIRVIDYKTGSHGFDSQKVETGEDLQLPAYLFTASLEQNKSIFGASQEQKLIPASAMFLSVDESGGRISPVRRGFILNDESVLTAASATKDSKILAGISYNKDGSLSARSRAAVTQDAINQMQENMTSAILTTAKNMYSGHAPRTPSESACKFCSLKSSCPVANKE